MNRRVESLEASLGEARANGDVNRRNGVIVATIGAGSAVLVALIYVGGTLLESPEPASCIEERARAAELASAHPGSWIPLSADDPVEKQCSINQFVDRIDSTSKSALEH